MPYTGEEKVKPKCPNCKKEMTFFQTDTETGLGGYHCPNCDNLGATHCHKRGTMIVGRP